ncbi:Linalool dehydratase/isomerase [Lachnellula suecica]|uniref:Linalool dehydratase/isomerase n=1 Tax=Lachnellula suecica TaxID=602035 RepID=A0A8T9CGC0_9HELO|nr:Linalool dehydratase/isomerase [Lachnellula suecica]
MGSLQLPKLTTNLNKYQKLSKEQAGHIRHFYNLAAQNDGEWKHMGSQEPMQEFLDAYRYQLALMSYAVGVTHYHRMPALRSVFKPLFRRLIHKMLRREVWGYWFSTSHAGPKTNPKQTTLRQPWADPVVRENIMYSGHLLLMTSLYGMLFQDDEFEKPGSIVFNWNPLFWGLGPETFTYDNRSLQKAILAEMERNDWVGVCCEPNLVFVVCNQFPIIAMRYKDIRDGTHVAEEVLAKYQKSWNKKGMVSPDGLLVDWFMVEQKTTTPARDVAFTAWAGAFMNTWNSNFVHNNYDRQALGFITKVDGEIRLQRNTVASAIRKLVSEDNTSPSSLSTLEKAQDIAAQAPPSPFLYVTPTYGYVTQWLSELGKKKELEALLQYADEKLYGTWENGGYFYKRFDGHGGNDWTFMDPFSGNGGIPYSTLNVKNGQKKMWEEPWTRSMLEERPWVDGAGLESGGVWDAELGILLVTGRTWDGSLAKLELTARNLKAGEWAAFVGGRCLETRSLGPKADFEVFAEFGGDEVDVVFKLMDIHGEA